jgi:hypothetical protein
MPARTLLLALVLVLTLAAPGWGKGLGSVALCGADGCTDVTDRATSAILEGGLPTTPPRGAEPYFDVRITIEHEGETVDRWSVRWLPKSELMRSDDGTWLDTTPEAQNELVQLSSGLKPRGARPAKTEEEEGGGSSTTALAIGAPVAAAFAGVMLVGRRRRRPAE